MKPKPLKPIREVALAMLSRREHAAAELVSKLRAKGYMPAEIQAVVEALQAKGLQSDARYASAKSRQRLLGSWGQGKILQELRAKGVTADLAGDMLDQERADGPDEQARALAIVARRFKPQGPVPLDSTLAEAYHKEKNRRLNFLLRRGFALGVAQEAVRELG